MTDPRQSGVDVETWAAEASTDEQRVLDLLARLAEYQTACDTVEGAN